MKNKVSFNQDEFVYFKEENTFLKIIKLFKPGVDKVIQCDRNQLRPEGRDISTPQWILFCISSAWTRTPPF